MRNDQFADIAASGINLEGKGLKSINPEKYERFVLETNKNEEQYSFPSKMSTKAELELELETWRKRYSPFMEKLSPEFETLMKSSEIKNFKWREEQRTDQTDFSRVLAGLGEWREISVPHYGGPLGQAVTYYYSEFHVEWGAEEAVFLYFRGVDYIGKVYVNGAFAGSHEGFFSAFRLDVTKYAKFGVNSLLVQVENDFIHKRNERTVHGTMYGGDKIYAATGPGYDDPQMGWHHCPPGMGIWQPVYVEVRNRCFLEDIFVRPLPAENRAEAWLEVHKCEPGFEDVEIRYSLYGRNFKETVFEGRVYKPQTSCAIGLGDTFTKANLTASGAIHKPVGIFMEKGINYLRIPFSMTGYRLWSPTTPYLYELQVELIDKKGEIIDRKKQHFGMRSFTMENKEGQRGFFYLNGEEIRLRGANTMGHEQQCVIKEDFDQLKDDLLLARICNMNFLRLTQRPVQEEIYEYCDMLGLMTQTDFPLFGVLRINKFAEAIRQVEEMEKIVRKHPCNILVSFINEPFPNAYNQPHRHLSRENLMRFFECAEAVVKMNNPERVTKHVDGDYDPPSMTLPDNHCYTLWYNGSGIDAGALHKGYWLPVTENWNCGCGEYGAEGLDHVETMNKYYPVEWLPEDAEQQSNWSPAKIIASQTDNFHYFFYDTKKTLADWVKASQDHQAWTAKRMTEAFRRNKQMVSSAIHLFIDAFPAGWMKAIMDCDRNPKPAYFTYRDALTPVMVSLRTDKDTIFFGEESFIEVWGCNDISRDYRDIELCYETWIETDAGQKISCESGKAPCTLPGCSSNYLGSIRIMAPKQEGTIFIRSGIRHKGGGFIHWNSLDIKVKAVGALDKGKKVCVIGNLSKAQAIAQALGLAVITAQEVTANDVILVDEWEAYLLQQALINGKIIQGATAIFLELPPGDYSFETLNFSVKNSSMMPIHFVSRNTDHPLVHGYEQFDFRYWYDKRKDMITPIMETTFAGSAFLPVLVAGNTDEKGIWKAAMAVGEGQLGQGKVFVTQLKLAERMEDNPIAMDFTIRLLNEKKYYEQQ